MKVTAEDAAPAQDTLTAAAYRPEQTGNYVWLRTPNDMMSAVFHIDTLVTASNNDAQSHT